MRDKKKELKAIELGKEWMKRSVNVLHDYKHAQHVANHSVALLKELKKKNLLPDSVDENVVLLAAWWHDCYKSLKVNESLYAIAFEGRESVKIIRKELSDLVDEETLEIVLSMVKLHNIPAPFFVLFRSPYKPTFRLLYEADFMEGFDPERIKKSFGVFGFWARLFFKVYYWGYPIFMYILPHSDYLKDYFSERKA